MSPRFSRSIASLPRTPRGAFTLIELLVVISIIAILLSLTVSVTLAFVTSAREAATQTTLAKIKGKLERRTQALRQGMETGSGNASRVGSGAAGPLRLKMEMLNRMPSYLYPRGAGPDGDFGTADDPLPLSENDHLVALVRGNGTVTALFDDANYRNDPTASSEALLLFLTQGETYGVADTDEDAFKESELADADGDGLREIVDGFGNPIRFYRWPTRLIRPAPDADNNGLVSEAEAQADNTDGRWPMSAYGTTESAGSTAALLGSTLPSREFGDAGEITADATNGDPFLPTLGSALRSDPDDRFAQIHFGFATIFRRALTNPADPYSDMPALGKDFERLFHTPTTFYSPIAVSAGADGELGLYEPQDRENFGHLAQFKEPVAALDNLTTAQTGF
ncbi:type II secretion system protein [Alienimonas chondri]|uniref:Prepilin-type N-terminal cleavage/methylation domain-containing protein n=1 Tax=Alienimonas chondri TaxID=2681879 RepID=A0ABX1VFU9_9PLAN|nr:type II secretion system protein [Alienimonas chondri]NNJ26891.1 hypothetical protein [Alienimonas chondri]